MSGTHFRAILNIATRWPRRGEIRCIGIYKCRECRMHTTAWMQEVEQSRSQSRGATMDVLSKSVTPIIIKSGLTSSVHLLVNNNSCRICLVECYCWCFTNEISRLRLCISGYGNTRTDLNPLIIRIGKTKIDYQKTSPRNVMPYGSSLSNPLPGRSISSTLI